MSTGKNGELGSRRTFLRTAGVSALAVAAGCASSGPSARVQTGPEAQGEGVSATEDLMREHGVLDRLLLVYEAAGLRLAANQDLPQKALYDTATLIRQFVEGYHEQLEERYVFPRFERAGQLVELVGVLKRQHTAGRQLTEVVLRNTAPDSPVDRTALAGALAAYLRMYRPHSAREDTVLFPALRKLAGASEVAELGEQFEEIEHERFGKGGFEGIVSHVADIERALGIHQLDAFTPRPAAAAPPG